MPFYGTFDGQGYTISNLKVNTSSQYVGIFGYSKGFATIRNVVVDSSCSFTSTDKLMVYIGGIIGDHYESGGPFLAENCVNMGSLFFDRNVSSRLYIGGIAGEIKSTDFESNIVNCANYGPITFSGSVRNKYAYIGGIVGGTKGLKEVWPIVYNCVNYGSIAMEGTVASPYVGGIVGESRKSEFKNCLSAGKISTITEIKLIGTISGNASTVTNITNCYWTSDAGSYESCGYDGLGTGLSTVTDSSSIEPNEEGLNKLNTNAEANSWSKWLLATNDATVSFKANSNGKAFELSSGFVLIPEFESPWRDFEGWFDGENAFVATSISESKTLTGKFTNKDFTLIFDLGNGTVLNEMHAFDEPITYPYTVDLPNKYFGGWDTTFDKMLGEDTIVRGTWFNCSDTVDVTFGTIKLIERDIKKISRELSNDESGKSFDVEQYVIDGVNEVITATIKFDTSANAIKFLRACVDKKKENNILSAEFLYK